MNRDHIIKFSFVILVSLIVTYLMVLDTTVEDTIKYFSFVFLFTDLVYDFLKENKYLGKFDSLRSSNLEVFISLTLSIFITAIIVITVKPFIELIPTIKTQSVKLQTIDVIILFSLTAKLLNTTLKDNQSTEKLSNSNKHFFTGYSLHELQETLK